MLQGLGLSDGGGTGRSREEVTHKINDFCTLALLGVQGVPMSVCLFVCCTNLDLDQKILIFLIFQIFRLFSQSALSAQHHLPFWPLSEQS